MGPLTHTRYNAALDAKGGSGVGQPKGHWTLATWVLAPVLGQWERGWEVRPGFRITDENPGPGIFTLLTWEFPMHP